jgi:hypothetical protein
MLLLKHIDQALSKLLGSKVWLFKIGECMLGVKNGYYVSTECFIVSEFTEELGKKITNSYGNREGVTYEATKTPAIINGAKCELVLIEVCIRLGPVKELSEEEKKIWALPKKEVQKTSSKGPIPDLAKLCLS